MDDLVQTLRNRIDELQERIRQLEAALSPTDHMPPIEWQLTAAEARVYACIASRELATRAAIMATLYSDRVDEGAEPKIIDVFVCKLRKKVRAYGVNIETVWGQGYRLAKAAKVAA